MPPDHPPECLTGKQYRRGQVNGNETRPNIVRKVGQKPGNGDTRVIDQHVDPAERVLRLP